MQKKVMPKDTEQTDFFPESSMLINLIKDEKKEVTMPVLMDRVKQWTSVYRFQDSHGDQKS